MFFSEVHPLSWVTSCQQKPVALFSKVIKLQKTYLKSDLPQVWHIYKSDHEGNTEFSIEVGYTFCEGEGWCKLHQSLF